MHHPRVTEQLLALLEFACDRQQTCFDVPRLRTMSSGGYLRTGIALAVPPHRDTGYGGSQAQLNWWIPLHELTPDSCMAVYSAYFERGVLNTSADYDHRAWLSGARQEAARHVRSDTRSHPVCREEIEARHEVRLLCPPEGLLLFSASHLHATVPNTSGRTRLSVRCTCPTWGPAAVPQIGTARPPAPPWPSIGAPPTWRRRPRTPWPGSTAGPRPTRRAPSASEPTPLPLRAGRDRPGPMRDRRAPRPVPGRAPPARAGSPQRTGAKQTTLIATARRRGSRLR